MRSIALSCLQQYERAAADADRVMELAPHIMDGYYHKGFALFHLKDYAGAVSLAAMACLGGAPIAGEGRDRGGEPGLPGATVPCKEAWCDSHVLTRVSARVSTVWGSVQGSTQRGLPGSARRQDALAYLWQGNSEVRIHPCHCRIIAHRMSGHERSNGCPGPDFTQNYWHVALTLCVASPVDLSIISQAHAFQQGLKLNPTDKTLRQGFWDAIALVSQSRTEGGNEPELVPAGTAAAAAAAALAAAEAPASGVAVAAPSALSGAEGLGEGAMDGEGPASAREDGGQADGQ